MFMPNNYIGLQYRRPKRLRLLILVVLWFSFQTEVSLAVDYNIPNDKKFSGVDFKNGLLRVSVEKQEFKEIMGKVAKEAGIKIFIDHPYNEKISIRFDYLPLEKGLRQLLGEKNYAFMYKSGESDTTKSTSGLMNVFVFSKPEDETVTESGGLEKYGFSNNVLRKMTMNEIQNLVMDKLKGALALQSSLQDRTNQRKQINVVMENLKELGLYSEKIEDGVSPIEKIKEALHGIQGMENIIIE